jgi:hypothetical protein
MRDIPLGFTYDDNMRVLSYRDADKWYVYTRNAAGRALTFRDSDGYWSERQYTASGRLIAFKDSMGNRSGSIEPIAKLSVDIDAYAFGLAQAKAEKTPFPGELTEAQLVGYFQAARSTGAIDDDLIPELMALYGSMHPMDFHNEIRRKMRLTKEEDFAEHRSTAKADEGSGRLSTIKQASLEKGELVFFDGDAPEAGPGVYRIAMVYGDDKTTTRGHAVFERDWVSLCDPEDSDRHVLAIVRADCADMRGLRQSNRYEGVAQGRPIFTISGRWDDAGEIGIVEKIETRDGEVHEDDDLIVIRAYPDRGVESLMRVHARDLWALRPEEYDRIVDSRKRAENFDEGSSDPAPLFEKGAFAYFEGRESENVRAGVYQVALIKSPSGETVDRAAVYGDEVWLASGDKFDLNPIKVSLATKGLRALSTDFDSRMVELNVGAPVFIHDGTREYDLGTIDEIETEDFTVCNETDIVMVKVDLPDGREIYPRVHAANLWPLTKEEFDAITAGRSNPSPEEGAPTP